MLRNVETSFILSASNRRMLYASGPKSLLLRAALTEQEKGSQMDLHSTNLLGVFTCNFSPENYEYKDWYIHSNDILIYLDTSQRLAFSYLLCREDNLNWFCELEEGFVHLDAALQEIHFEVRQHYDWNTRGRPGYGGD